MKRRKLAPAAIFLAGLLLAAVAAASVSAATSSPAKATKSAAVPAGKLVHVSKSRPMTRVGTSGFASSAAKPVGALPAKNALAPRIAKGVAAAKASKLMPPKRATGAKASSFSAQASVVNFPQATSLPIHEGGFKGTSVVGLSAYNQATVGGYEVTPSDNALCEGNGFVVQGVNNLIGIWDTSLHQVAAAEALESFFSPALVTTGYDSLSDPKCYYDPDTRHWYFTILAFNGNGTAGSAVFIAVSTLQNPVGSWNIYVLDTTFDGTTCAPPGAPGDPWGCLADQPLLGANKNAIFISTNSFDWGSTAFNGAQMYVIDKTGLALGLGSVNTVWMDLGFNFLTPEGLDDCGLPFVIFCWYSVQPALTPNAAYTTDRGGTEFALSALDWFLSIDNRIALWAITGTSTITQVFPSVDFQYAIYTGQSYGFPPLSPQKEGPIPFGDTFVGPPSPGVQPLQTNDDRMNEVKFVKTKTNAYVMGALNTIVKVPTGQGPVLAQRAGIAYWILRPIWAGPFLIGATKYIEGYIANAFEDVMFPSSALGPQALGATIAYTLNGHEFFPTAALSTLSPTKAASVIQVAGPIGADGTRKGQSPNDDFCEYGFCPSPRWGDYSAGVADGSDRYAAVGAINFPNCSDVEYIFDATCGGTRGQFTNWGTVIIKSKD